jgi:hypothetical protein
MRRPLATALLGVPQIAGLGLLTLSGAGFADWIERDEGSSDDGRWAAQGPAPGSDPTYISECGVCHLAYPPQFLPARSWERIMDGLADHFGDNAELPATEAHNLRAYLAANAGDRSGQASSRGFVASVAPSAIPLRITDTPYFRRQHHEIPSQIVQNNQQVVSFANCQACHKDAEKGSYDEHRVAIPGYARWDD